MATPFTLLTLFRHFFALGWVCFGGPSAHLSYFKHHFVDKHQWLDNQSYAQLIALSQFLPGPGSSQVGFAIGYRLRGIAGGVAAFLGFTTPSILLMLLFAYFAHRYAELEVIVHIIAGLKLLAVVVVFDACLGMFAQFCQRKSTIACAAISASTLLIFPSVATQMTLLLMAALWGAFALTVRVQPQADTLGQKPSIKWWALLSFVILLLILPLMADLGAPFALLSGFYQAGSLVFGGGHVVLPLLSHFIGPQLDESVLLAGYGAAQAVPGPMFTLATYIGAQLIPEQMVLGALLATISIFLPGFLLIIALLDGWQQLASHPRLGGAVLAINAAVVGLLASALYHPIFTSSVSKPLELAVVIIGVMLLRTFKLPIVLLVGLFIGLGLLLNG